MISLLTNITFLRLVAIVMILIVTAAYILKKETTVKSFVLFLAGNFLAILVLALAEYLKNATALTDIIVNTIVSVAIVILFDAWLIARARKLEK